MSQHTPSLTDELTSTGAFQTDHGALKFTDVLLLILDGVLFIYTGWRSYHFLSGSMPDGMEIMGLVGLWGLDIGVVVWSLVWIFGSAEKYQDWTAMAFFLIDLIGVVLTTLTDSLTFSSPDGTMTATLQGIAAPAIPLIVVANVIAGFIYHMTSPRVRLQRERRKTEAEYRRKMDGLDKMERDLVYTENYLLARQEQLDKAEVLSELKIRQDAVEHATRAKLRDGVGMQSQAKKLGGVPQDNNDKLAGLISKLNRATPDGAPDQPAPANHNQPAASQATAPEPVLVSYVPFIARLACQFNDHTVTVGDALEAGQTPDGNFLVRRAGEDEPFACLSLYDLGRLMSGKEEDLGMTEMEQQLVPAKVRANGNGNGAHPGNTESPT